MTTILLAVDHSNTPTSWMLQDDGFKPVISDAHDVAALIEEFDRVGADVLMIEPGMPFSSERFIIEGLYPALGSRPVVFSSVSDHHWRGVLRGVGIEDPVADLGSMFRESWREEIEEALGVETDTYDHYVYYLGRVLQSLQAEHLFDIFCDAGLFEINPLQKIDGKDLWGGHLEFRDEEQKARAHKTLAYLRDYLADPAQLRALARMKPATLRLAWEDDTYGDVCIHIEGEDLQSWSLSPTHGHSHDFMYRH